MLLSILQRYISRQEEEKLKIIIDKHGKEKEVTEFRKDNSSSFISWMWWKSWWPMRIMRIVPASIPTAGCKTLIWLPMNT